MLSAPRSVARGRSAVLTWHASNATACRASWGVAQTHGTFITSPLTAEQVFWVECARGEDRYLRETVTVAVEPVVKRPTLEILEEVAVDGVQYLQSKSSLHNTWGNNQSRITRHADGTVRLAYLTRPIEERRVPYKVMKRSPWTGTWSIETTGETSENLHLIRHPVNDAAVVMEWPFFQPYKNRRPYIRMSPQWISNEVSVRGLQGVTSSTARRDGLGISEGGTLCFVLSYSNGSTLEKPAYSLEYACGTLAKGDNSWVWGEYFRRNIGYSYAYPFVFSGAGGVERKLLIAAMHNESARNLGYISVPPGTFIRDGFKVFVTDPYDASAWNETYALRQYPLIANADRVPQRIPSDHLIDSRGRLLSIHRDSGQGTGVNPSAAGHYLTVTSITGAELSQTKLNLSTVNVSGRPLGGYGSLKLVEDDRHRLWIVYRDLGVRYSEIGIYRLEEKPGLVFRLVDYTSFKDDFYPYPIEMIRIASPRSGNALDNGVDGIAYGCRNTYSPNALYSYGSDSTNECYSIDGKPDANQRVFYFRIRLPD